MEYPSKVVAGTQPPDWHLAQTAHEDLRLLGMPRVNLLLVGAGGMTRNVVDMLLRDRDEPLATWKPGEGLLLPPVARGGTVVLHDVGALSHEYQRHLLDWLDNAAGRTQVISTTSGSLLPQVQSGAFIETLFYRLNTVCLDLTA